MFYCPRCAKKWRWPDWGFQSFGRCEMCTSVAYCFDVPASKLPDPIGVLTDEEVLRDGDR